MQLPIYQVDAFSDRLFCGNPAAVVLLDNWLPAETLQNIAAENNLAETAYFIQKDDHFDLRWFTPACEVDLCGHATVATAHVIWEHLGYQESEIVFSSRSGRLGVTKSGCLYTLDFPTDIIEKCDPPEAFVKGIGGAFIDAWKGREDYLLVFDHQGLVEQLEPDFRLLGTIKARGVIATAPGNDVDFVSRCFFPAFGIDEDPVTGSAHTTLTPYWANRLGKSELTARQISRRGGYLQCRLDGSRTHISGNAVTYLTGTITI